MNGTRQRRNVAKPLCGGDFRGRKTLIRNLAETRWSAGSPASRSVSAARSVWWPAGPMSARLATSAGDSARSTSRSCVDSGQSGPRARRPAVRPWPGSMPEHSGLAGDFPEVAGPRRHHDQPARGLEHAGELGCVAGREHHGDDVDGGVRQRDRLPDVADQVHGFRVEFARRGAGRTWRCPARRRRRRGLSIGSLFFNDRPDGQGPRAGSGPFLSRSRAPPGRGRCNAGSAARPAPRPGDGSGRRRGRLSGQPPSRRYPTRRRFPCPPAG